MDTIDYPWPEFQEHMIRFLQVAGPTEQQMEDYFLRYYSDAKAARWKFQRFLAAFAYQEISHGKLEEFYIRGGPPGAPPGGMIDENFIIALWRYFSRCPDHLLRIAPPIEQILQLARETKAARQRDP